MNDATKRSIAATEVDCPLCKASVGNACRDPEDGGRVGSHEERHARLVPSNTQLIEGLHASGTIDTAERDRLLAEDLPVRAAPNRRPDIETFLAGYDAGKQNVDPNDAFAKWSAPCASAAGVTDDTFSTVHDDKPVDLASLTPVEWRPGVGLVSSDAQDDEACLHDGPWRSDGSCLICNATAVAPWHRATTSERPMMYVCATCQSEAKEPHSFTRCPDATSHEWRRSGDAMPEKDDVRKAVEAEGMEIVRQARADEAIRLERENSNCWMDACKRHLRDKVEAERQRDEWKRRSEAAQAEHDWKGVAAALMLAKETGEELASVRHRFGLDAPRTADVTHRCGLCGQEKNENAAPGSRLPSCTVGASHAWDDLRKPRTADDQKDDALAGWAVTRHREEAQPEFLKDHRGGSGNDVLEWTGAADDAFLMCLREAQAYALVSYEAAYPVWLGVPENPERRVRESPSPKEPR